MVEAARWSAFLYLRPGRSGRVSLYRRAIAEWFVQGASGFDDSEGSREAIVLEDVAGFEIAELSRTDGISPF